jgi:hypothetical protein
MVKLMGVMVENMFCVMVLLKLDLIILKKKRYSEIQVQFDLKALW